MRRQDRSLPVLSSRLLSWAARRLQIPELADSAAELFREKARRQGERAARRWYRRQVRASVRRAVLRGGRRTLHRLLGREADPPRAAGSAAPIRRRDAAAARRSEPGPGHQRPRRDAKRRGPGPGRRRPRWAARPLESVVHDLHQARRSLAARPGWTVAVLLTLSLGLGSTSAVYSVVDAVVLRPLPYDQPERLLALSRWDEEQRRPRGLTLSFPAWDELRRGQDVFDRIGAFTPTARILTDDVTTEPVDAALLSASMLEVLGVEPRLGRGFVAADDEPGAAGVVILSHGAWQRRFAGDPEALGRSITVNHEPHRIVGVMPEGFAFPDPNREMWLPLASLPRGAGFHFLTVVGRLAPGVTVEQAAARLSSLDIDLAAGRPITLRPTSLQAHLVGDVDRPLLLLLAVVGVVLLIAAVNVGGLTTSRAVARRAEHDVRRALGASRGRLARTALVESLVLAGAGAVGGLLLAAGFTRAMLGLRADALPRQGEVGLHPRVMLFTLAAAVVLALVAGLAPLLGGMWRHDGGVRSGRLAPGRGPGWDRGRAAPVVLQIALTTVLLFGAGLLLRSLSEKIGLARGFERSGVVILRTRLPGQRYAAHAERHALYEELEARLTATPAVDSMALADLPPYLMQRVHRGVDVELATGDSERLVAEVLVVSPGYFDTLRVPLVAGRIFSRDEPHPVAVVNRTMARRLWPPGEALGRRIRREDAPPATVVGVVADTSWGDLQPEAPPQVYFPYGQQHDDDMVVLLRVRSGAASGAIAATRALLRDMDPEIAVTELGTLDARLARQVAGPRFRGALVGTFAGMALALTFFGIFGVVAYTVASRTRELGVRKALGARPAHLLIAVLRRAGGLALAGVALGGVGGWWATGLLEAYLFEVRPHDPWTLCTVAALMTSTVIGAALPPAWRAARVDPIVALEDS